MPESKPFISEKLRRAITTRATGRCEYCRCPEAFATERFSIEHIVPRRNGGRTEAENLALSCQGCNSHKAAKTQAIDPQTDIEVSLFNPRASTWNEHFTWSLDHLRIIGLDATGRATIQALRLNRPALLNLRLALVAVGVHPPGK